jgi:hypothetical protein
MQIGCKHIDLSDLPSCPVCCVLCAVCRVLCTVCCVLCTVYCVLCAVYCVLCVVCCVLCAVCCVLCTVCCVLCAVYCVLCAVCCVLCTVCCVLCAVYCVLCAVALRTNLKTFVCNSSAWWRIEHLPSCIQKPEPLNICVFFWLQNQPQLHYSETSKRSSEDDRHKGAWGFPFCLSYFTPLFTFRLMSTSL